MFYLRDYNELIQGILNINQTSIGISLYHNQLSLMNIYYSNPDNGIGDVEFSHPKFYKTVKGAKDIYVLHKYFVIVDYDLEKSFRQFNFNYRDLKKQDIEDVKAFVNQLQPVDYYDIVNLLQTDPYQLAQTLEITEEAIYEHQYCVVELFNVIDAPPILEALNTIKNRCDGNNKKIVKLLVNKYKSKVLEIIKEEKRQETKRDLSIVFSDLMQEFYQDVQGNHALVQLIAEVPVWE